MSDFVRQSGSLPFPKYSLGVIPANADPTRYIRKDDWNSLNQSVASVRRYVLSGTVGLEMTGSWPGTAYPDLASYGLWLNTSGDLYFHTPSGDSKLNGQTGGGGTLYAAQINSAGSTLVLSSSVVDSVSATGTYIRTGVPIYTPPTNINNGASVLSIDNGTDQMFRFKPKGTYYYNNASAATYPTIVGDADTAWLTLSALGGVGLGYTNDNIGFHLRASPIEFDLDAVTRWFFDNSAGSNPYAFQPYADNSYDIGYVTKRVRNVYSTTVQSVSSSLTLKSSVTSSATATNVKIDTGYGLSSGDALIRFYVTGSEMGHIAPVGTGQLTVGYANCPGIALNGDSGGVQGGYVFAQQYWAGMGSRYYGSSLTMINGVIINATNAGYTLLTLGSTANVANQTPTLVFNTANKQQWFGIGTNNADVQTVISEGYLVSSQVYAGDVVVWTDYRTVGVAPSVSNTTRIAGVAITTAASGSYAQIATRGRVAVKCSASFAPTAGDLAGTSVYSTGTITNGVPGAGAVLGRILSGENVGSAGVGKCWVYLTL